MAVINFCWIQLNFVLTDTVDYFWFVITRLGCLFKNWPLSKCHEVHVLGNLLIFPWLFYSGCPGRTNQNLLLNATSLNGNGELFANVQWGAVKRGQVGLPRKKKHITTTFWSMCHGRIDRNVVLTQCRMLMKIHVSKCVMRSAMMFDFHNKEAT